jgi:hypothetical protein
MACECTPGETLIEDDGCNTCTCQADGSWACTDLDCECTPGETRLDDDGCNTCTCLDDSTWACTDMACECTPGDTMLADDGCNTCTCQEDGTWACTDLACECTPGETQPADDGCNTCTCQEDGTWACTLMACPECEDGDTKLADDGCNTCRCADGFWACTEMACAECPAARPQDPDTGCADVVVWAKDPDTGMCCEYGSPCDAPLDWEQYYSMDECESAFICPDPIEYDGGCIAVVVVAKDPVTGACCEYGTPCNAPADWMQYSSMDECESAPDGVFMCGDSIRCLTGEEYCYEVIGGAEGSETSYECVAFDPGCPGCDCLADTLDPACDCHDSAGTTTVSCAMP